MQNRLEGVVVPAVLALNCRHAETDRHRLSILYYFAAWFWESFGRVLNPKTDLTPGNIQQYCHYRQDVHSSTHSSITMVLTRIRDGDPAKKAPTPTTKQHPAYSETQRHRLLDDAERIPDERWRREVLTALYLAFDAGARMGEMAALRGTDLYTHSADSITVRITTERTIREVPVYDGAARHLRQFIGDPGYVVNPGQASRRSNAIPHLRHAAQRQNPKFADLDFSAARRNYFINLMARPVPMNIVMYLGDAHATEDMPQALFWYTARPTPAQVRAAIKAARTQ